MYRAVAYAYAMRKPADMDAFLAGLILEFSFDTAAAVSLDGLDITQEIRTPEVSMLASSLSQDPRVRAYCTGMQRRIGEAGGIVAEGRDTGSVVFPGAHVKFYLDADLAERARRRHLESSGSGGAGDVERVREEMERRDRADSGRDIAPLVRPEGALFVDTTGKTVEEVVAVLEARVRQALK
jgi:cytidylate kinase